MINDISGNYADYTFSLQPENLDMIPTSGLIVSMDTHALWPDTSSAIKCAYLCIKYAACISFFFKTPEGRCQLHKSHMYDKSNLKSEIGWRHYTIPARLPTTCVEAKRCGLSKKEDYWIQPNASLTNRVKLYCESDGDYISLNSTLNFFETKAAADGCNNPVSIRTNYSKISVNLTSLLVNIHDTRFAEKQGSDFQRYGKVEDCSGSKDLSCIRAKGSIYLTGTGFRLSEKTTWIASGYQAAILDFSSNLNTTEITFSCAGYCGACRSESGLLFLEIAGQQDEMEVEDLVYCRG